MNNTVFGCLGLLVFGCVSSFLCAKTINDTGDTIYDKKINHSLFLYYNLMYQSVTIHGEFVLSTAYIKKFTLFAVKSLRAEQEWEVIWKKQLRLRI